MKKYDIQTIREFEELTKHYSVISEQMEKSVTYFQEQSDSFKELIAEVKSIKEVDDSGKFKDIIDALDKIDFNPVINVQKERITIPEPQVKVVTNDVYDEYKVSDTKQDKNGGMIYHIFLNRSGNWFVLRQSGKENVSYRYASYKNNDVTFAQALSNPSPLDYVLFSEMKL